MASDTLENAATVKIYGEATDDAFSAMRLRAEDLNRDGKEDLVTSAVGYDSGANVDAGKVYMFYAPLAGTLSAGPQMLGMMEVPFFRRPVFE